MLRGVGGVTAKVRKQRRAQRLAESQRRQEQEATRAARRLRRRELWRRLTLHGLRQRSSGRLFARRSRGERAFIAVLAVFVLFVIWTLVPSLALKVALSLLFLLALPVLVIVALDRRGS